MTERKTHFAPGWHGRFQQERRRLELTLGGLARYAGVLENLPIVIEAGLATEAAFTAQSAKFRGAGMDVDYIKTGVKHG